LKHKISVWVAGIFAVLFSLSTAVKADDLEQGRKLFEGKCARCHGKDGTGNAKMAPNLKVDTDKLNLHRDEVVHKTLFEIETMVDSGDHKMPKYRGKLTDAQIHQVAMYMKQLTGNASAKDETAAPADPAATKKLFEAKCSQCHAKDATGNEKMAKVLKVDAAQVNLTKGAAAEAAVSELVTIVTNGKNKMPSFKAKLTPDQVEQLASYVKGLQGPSAK